MNTAPVTTAQLHRSLGALLGLAVGDALGAPFEFGPAGQWSTRFPEPVRGGTGEMIGGGCGWKPGEFTDDTQMALALAESLITHDRLDLDDVWDRFRAWATEAKDVGNITRAALSHADRHGAAEAAHQRLGRSAGNGSLMRVLPLSLAFLNADIETLMRAACEQSALTHADPAAGWGAAVYAELVRRTIVGDSPFEQIDAILAEVPEPADGLFKELLDPRWHPDRGGPGNGSVWGCLAQAVWAVRTTSTFEQAVAVAIELGDDTDTVAAVAGGLAGSIYDIQSIPSRWLTYVNGTVATPRGTQRYDNAALQDTARKLLRLQPALPTPVESPAGPTQVAPGLYAADLGGAATSPTDWAVLSLCRTDNRFANHPARREMFIIDREGRNSNLFAALGDAVDTIDAWHKEGRTVVVHCHGGRSRTGLVLKAWAMRSLSMNEREAHDWLARQWERYEDYSHDFRNILRNEWSLE
ncbi:MAG: ADP-ribosylglycohydrolase family protein [Actinomycetota bacterium]|nr:ADP-ribosylglycohydrolase family protein [Actinomycetota bacterium]